MDACNFADVTNTYLTDRMYAFANINLASH